MFRYWCSKTFASDLLVLTQTSQLVNSSSGLLLSVLDFVLNIMKTVQKSLIEQRGWKFVMWVLFALKDERLL